MNSVRYSGWLSAGVVLLDAAVLPAAGEGVQLETAQRTSGLDL